MHLVDRVSFSETRVFVCVPVRHVKAPPLDFHSLGSRSAAPAPVIWAQPEMFGEVHVAGVGWGALEGTAQSQSSSPYNAVGLPKH